MRAPPSCFPLSSHAEAVLLLLAPYPRNTARFASEFVSHLLLANATRTAVQSFVFILEHRLHLPSTA